MWVQHYLACDDVRVTGVTVRSLVNKNNDGINIDSCRRVIISDCNIESGDDAIVEEATALLGDLEGAVLKWSYGFHSAKTVMPEVANALIHEKVTRALGRLTDFHPWRLEGPIQTEVSFKNYLPAELLAYLPIVDRVDSHTIAFTGRDMIEVSRFLAFLGRYRPDISP
jgi:D-amino peptidase